MSKKKAQKTEVSVWFYALAVFVLDQVTKWLTVAYLPQLSRNAFWYPYGGIGVFKDVAGVEFSLVHATNKGAAWGAFSDYQGYLLTARIILIVLVLLYALFYNNHPKWQIPLALIIGGAFSNIVDYFVYGHVIDMFHFVFWGYDYPVFNIADSAICIGIAWIFLLSLFGESKGKKKKR